MVRLKAGQKPRHRPRSQGQSPNSPPRQPAPAAFTASTQLSRPPPGPTTSASKTKRSPFNVRPLSHCRAGPRGHASRRTPDATAQPRHGRKGQPYNRSSPSFVIRHSAPAPRARPGFGADKPDYVPCLAALRLSFLSATCVTVPPKRDAAYPRLSDGPSSRLFCLAPEWVFRAAVLTNDAVGSYPTFSPLPVWDFRSQI